jgi:hypothetical protein
MLLRMQRVWGNEPSHSQANSHVASWTPQMDSQIFRMQLQGPKPSAWKVLYIIGKLLKLKCLKWAHIAHLNIWSTSYGQKKRRKSNWQFDFQSLKVRNQPNFLSCKQCVTYRWKVFDEGYNFALDFIVIRSLHAKLCASKVTYLVEFKQNITICNLQPFSPLIKNFYSLGIEKIARF